MIYEIRFNYSNIGEKEKKKKKWDKFLSVFNECELLHNIHFLCSSSDFENSILHVICIPYLHQIGFNTILD